MIFQEFMPYGFGLVTFVPMIVGLLINIAVAVFISKQCQKRGMEPTMFVLLTCCCGWLIGGIVYLVSASNNPPQDEFQQPTFSSNQGQVYGQKQQPIYEQTQPTQPKPSNPDAITTMPNINKTFCPICGSQNQKNAMYCSHCGANLK